MYCLSDISVKYYFITVFIVILFHYISNIILLSFLVISFHYLCNII